MRVSFPEKFLYPVALFSLLFVLTACGGGGSSSPGGGGPPITQSTTLTITSGNNQVYLAGITMPQPLSVVVGDPRTGLPVYGSTVVFAAPVGVEVFPSSIM